MPRGEIARAGSPMDHRWINSCLHAPNARNPVKTLANPIGTSRQSVSMRLFMKTSRASLEAEGEVAMESIQNRIETALAGISPAVRIGLTAIMTAVVLVLSMDAGTSLGKALYYLTH
jgi:hypothetical protein